MWLPSQSWVYVCGGGGNLLALPPTLRTVESEPHRQLPSAGWARLWEAGRRGKQFTPGVNGEVLGQWEDSIGS